MQIELPDSFTHEHRLAVLRVLSAERASRELRTNHLRKNFGERLPKNMTAEVEQLELETVAIDTLFKALSPE